MKIEFYHIDAFEVPNYEPVWRKLIEMGIDARMVGVPRGRNAAAGDWFDFERFNSYCTQNGIPFTTDADPTADIAITTQNIDILRDYHCPRTRIMYGPILYPHAWGLQEHATKPFDAVLTHSPLYAQIYSQWRRLDQLPVVGYPRYDDYFSGKLKRDIIRSRWGITGNRPVVAFLPTWGDNTAFEKFLPELLKLSQQYEILLRPHHCTLRFEPARMKMLEESGLTILENAFDLAEIYAASDVILSDARSGSMVEACMCNKPTVAMVMNPEEITGWLAANQVGNIASLCVDPTRLAQTLDEALNSKFSNQNQWADTHCSFRDGNAGKQAAIALVHLAERNKKTISQKSVLKNAPSLSPIPIDKTSLNG